MEKKFINAFPFRLFWVHADAEAKAQVLFTVPKRKFKRAHDRNRIKRQMREAYRLNKGILYDALDKSDKHIALAILFTGNEHPEWETVSRKIILLLQRLTEELNSSKNLNTEHEAQ